MDDLLYEELLQEIFTRLPSTPSSSLSVSLVSKRWLRLYRSSRTSLSLRVPPHNSIIPSLSSFLCHYPSLSSLSILLSSFDSATSTGCSLSDHLLFAVSSSCPNLRLLRFLAGPVSFSYLRSLSTTCIHLTSLTVSLPRRPLVFSWIASFSCLKELSVHVCPRDGVEDDCGGNKESGLCSSEGFEAELGLESLYLSGIRAGDWGVGWLWKNCKRLKKLQLKSCESIGDGESLASFVKCLEGIEEVELRTCRSIVDGVLLKLAENCCSLTSLLVYDGGSREGLLHFISNCRCKLTKLDLRLPLDLKNNHLLAVALNFRGLSILRLQSCCLVTGEGLKTLGIALSSGLRELALINCDVVEREPGLLATLGQHFRQLKKLDLSYNEMLLDKEFVSMLASCNFLIELKLRGCKKLTGLAMSSMCKSCQKLESVDVVHCCGIEAEAVELFVLNSPQLQLLQVEESKISNAARALVLNRSIQVVV
ncbi:F-box/LRR-repeat protein 3 [Carica papaya]|uniref:F-box/LRR-repeat protein 3 n=1 Tax=Carica papaya TaxID=3649 RepID=UPI000B8CCB32|nr:F-box/LRR-repeat protein 3 [Carica papaya]